MHNEPLTTGQVAEYCHVTYRAVLKWITEGKLKAYRTPGKHSRVSRENFLEFLNKYNMPVPQELLKEQTKSRILIVDDDPEIVKLIRSMLNSDPRFEIQEAHDGFNAGRMFMEFSPGLVILDLNMPGMNGFEVCSLIRTDPKNKGVKIIIISGLPDPGVEEEILKLGADEFLSKPFDLGVLRKKIEKLLRMKGQDTIA